MRPDERDSAYLWDMLSAAREVDDMLRGVSIEQFHGNIMITRATERCIEIIGESARRVSKIVQHVRN